MARKQKTEGMSPPTIRKWLKTYLSETAKLVDQGKMGKEEGTRVAKGLKYAIKALEDSYSKYKADQRQIQEDEYEKATKELGV